MWCKLHLNNQKFLLAFKTFFEETKRFLTRQICFLTRNLKLMGVWWITKETLLFETKDVFKRMLLLNSYCSQGRYKIPHKSVYCACRSCKTCRQVQQRRHVGRQHSDFRITLVGTYVLTKGSCVLGKVSKFQHIMNQVLVEYFAINENYFLWTYVFTMLAQWCSGYRYCTFSFGKAWTQVLHRFKSCSQFVKRFVMVRISGNGPGWK